jgi:hypothetical protein
MLGMMIVFCFLFFCFFFVPGSRRGVSARLFMGGSERRSDRPQVKAGPLLLLLLLHQYIQPRLCAETRSSCCCARGTKVADWLAAMRASMGEEIFDGRRDFVRGIASSKHRDRNTSIGYYPSPLHGLPSVSFCYFFFFTAMSCRSIGSVILMNGPSAFLT